MHGHLCGCLVAGVLRSGLSEQWTREPFAMGIVLHGHTITVVTIGHHLPCLMSVRIQVLLDLSKILLDNDSK